MLHPHLATWHLGARTALSLGEYLSVLMDSVWVSGFTPHRGDRKPAAQDRLSSPVLQMTKPWAIQWSFPFRDRKSIPCWS